MSQTNNTSRKKDSRRKSDDIDYFGETAIGIYILVAVVLVFVVGFVFIDYLPYSYIYALYVAGFFSFIGLSMVMDGIGMDVFSSNSSYENKHRRQNNGKTLFSSNSKQKSKRSSFGFNDDYERGNREIWKNKWDQEAWNDHEYSCSHDDPWECRDENHF